MQENQHKRMIKLNESDAKALRALARYQYLTAKQMQRLGVGKTAKQVRDYTLNHLSHVKMVKSERFGVMPKVGHLANLYYLHDKAINTVAELLRCGADEIIYPKAIKFKNDYFHRLLFVDFHIGLRLWEQQDETAEIEFFNSYYTKEKGRGAGSPSINQLRFKPSDSLPYNYPLTIEPDGIFRLKRNGKAFLCAVEIHRKADSKYITQQLDRHITAIDQLIISEKFKHDSPNLVLSVHESLASFKSVQKRLLALPDFKPFLPFFHFSISGELEKDFSNWITADGEKSVLFR